MFFEHDLKLETGFTQQGLHFRTSPDNFSILFGFDASGERITSKGISCSESFQLLEILNEIFIFEIFEFSTDGPSVDQRWESLHVG